jgi:putative acetyltransferase
MPIVVRPLRENEVRTYLEIHTSAIRGLAITHYAPEVIEGWIVPITEDTIRDVTANTDHEIRLIAEIDGTPVGIGALVVERSELRACYVAAPAARRGCGSALLREIERLALEHGLTRLVLAASLNAEAFYASHGYEVRERREVVLGTGHRLPAVFMGKDLSTSPGPAEAGLHERQ